MKQTVLGIAVVTIAVTAFVVVPGGVALGYIVIRKFWPWKKTVG